MYYLFNSCFHYLISFQRNTFSLIVSIFMNSSTELIFILLKFLNFKTQYFFVTASHITCIEKMIKRITLSNLSHF